MPSSAPPWRTPASSTSRSARRTASTSTPARRSFARVSRDEAATAELGAAARRLEADRAVDWCRCEGPARLTHAGVWWRFSPSAAVLTVAAALPQPHPPPGAVRGPAEVEPAASKRELAGPVAARVSPDPQSAYNRQDNRARDKRDHHEHHGHTREYAA